MPKMKTHKGAQKRFRSTGTGKFKRAHAFTSHMFGNKTQKQKRKLRKSAIVAKGDEGRLEKMLPNK